MKKNIAEDLPARSHPQAQLSAQSQKSDRGDSEKGGGSKRGGDGKEKTPDQKIRQAVYDIRYRARRENLPIRTAYSQYMQNSSMSEMEKAEVRKRLFGKEGGTQAESFDMKSIASDTMAKALYKVFVDNQPKITEEYIEEIKKDFQSKSNGAESKKYKVRVTDTQSGVSYVRFATRSKISQLRARGLDVEMTEYGDAYEGEKEKGEQTAEVSRGRSRASKDYDGDGKVESGAKEHAGVVHNAIQRKKGLPADGKDTSSVKEEFMGEVLGMANLPQMDEPPLPTNNQNQQIDILQGKKNKITVNPTNSIMAHTELNGDLIQENGYKKFLNLLQEKKMTAAKKRKEKKLKKKYDDSSMKQNMQQQYGAEKGKKVYFAKIRKEAMKEESEECGCDDKKNKEDTRSIPTSVNLVKNKVRSMGVKM
jgi:hypothetical protein